MGTLPPMADGAAKKFARCPLPVLVALILLTSGCASTLDMRSVARGAPHTSIPYTGVRADAARFADYSVVDASILQ